jgi:DNA-binding transcriptional ArsR family regulator
MDELEALLSAVASRRSGWLLAHLIRRWRRGEAPSTRAACREAAAAAGLSLSQAYRDLKDLEQAGLVTRQPAGGEIRVLPGPALPSIFPSASPPAGPPPAPEPADLPPWLPYLLEAAARALSPGTPPPPARWARWTGAAWRLRLAPIPPAEREAFARSLASLFAPCPCEIEWEGG